MLSNNLCIWIPRFDCTIATETILRAHLFNDALWLDFTRIPAPRKQFLRFAALEEGDLYAIGERIFTPLPAVGYHVATLRGSRKRSTWKMRHMWVRQSRDGRPILPPAPPLLHLRTEMPPRGWVTHNGARSRLGCASDG
ncbi:hypothetical protein IQ285_35770 [Burkholderia sp. R-69608]|uniref:hypothetical protein n=1 Tax=Paraburkholderia nemoris TaxID=2793076 RepID=UPI001912CDA1|nr:hypothetical protein [Paraburkholderia nemoris]MBK5153042.1 hypothetical protein [Burkholderia sp. R-69608]